MESANNTVPPPEPNQPPQPFWERLRRFFTNQPLQTAPSADNVRNTVSPIRLLIDRYWYRRHCPYCFGFVTKQVYRERSRQGSVASTISTAPSSIRIYQCPNCAAELPSDFFASRSSCIALVGGTESGKSTFITVLCELLMNRHTILSELGISGSIINIDGREQFEENRQRLIEQEMALNLTTTMPHPTVLCLHSTQHQKVTYLTLLDSPGEYFTRMETLRTRHPNLQHATGIVFLMNPLDTVELVRMIRKESPGIISSNRPITARNYDIIENLYKLYLEGRRTKPNRAIKTPSAFCLSRADLLENITNLYAPPDFEPDLIDVEDILEETDLVAQDLRELLEDVDLNLINNMDKRFSNYSIFPVSALGQMPSSDAMGQRIPGGINPRGVLQPIIWLLRETKFISQP